MTDQELLEAIRNGDEKAFEQIVKKYEPQVAATVIGMLGPGNEAEDIGQEVFIRFYRAAHAFREESGLGTYLTRIAINLSLNAIKRRKRRRLIFQEREDREPHSTETPHDIATEAERKHLLYAALDKLDANFRSVVVLRMIDGYSTEESARILKIPLGTVLSRLARAHQKLKQLLAPLIKEET